MVLSSEPPLSMFYPAKMPRQDVDAVTSIVALLNSSRGKTIAVKVAEMNPQPIACQLDCLDLSEPHAKISLR